MYIVGFFLFIHTTVTAFLEMTMKFTQNTFLPEIVLGNTISEWVKQNQSFGVYSQSVLRSDALRVYLGEQRKRMFSASGK